VQQVIRSATRFASVALPYVEAIRTSARTNEASPSTIRTFRRVRIICHAVCGLRTLKIENDALRDRVKALENGKRPSIAGFSEGGLLGLVGFVVMGAGFINSRRKPFWYSNIAQHSWRWSSHKPTTDQGTVTRSDERQRAAERLVHLVA
jgi:hypothetical protein